MRSMTTAVVAACLLAPGCGQSTTPTPQRDEGPLPVTGPDTVAIHDSGRYVTYGATVENRESGCGEDQRCLVPYAVHGQGERVGMSREIAGDALRRAGAWASPDASVWAPSVAYHQGSYYMFYTATQEGTGDRGRKCIGVAVSDDARAAFEPRDTPLLCKPGGWSIDADAFEDPDSGHLYVAYRDDAATDGKQTAISVVRVDDDATEVVDKEAPVFTSDQITWEDGDTKNSHIVENPSMVKTGGTWYLFYSGNRWQTEKYATGIAKCGDELPSKCVPYGARGRDRPHFGYAGDGGLTGEHRPIAELPRNEIAPGGMDVFRTHESHELRASWNYKLKIDSNERRSLVGSLTRADDGSWRIGEE